MYRPDNRELKIRLLQKSKRCRACGESEIARPEVHHLTYENLGYEGLKDVVLLCRNCHILLHRFVKGSDPDLATFTKQFIRANGLIK